VLFKPVNQHHVADNISKDFRDIRKKDGFRNHIWMLIASSK
jgi:hypothetical protein